MSSTIRDMATPIEDQSPSTDQSLPIEDQGAPSDMPGDLDDMADLVGNKTNTPDMPDLSDMPDAGADMADAGDMPCDVAAKIAEICGEGKTGDPCNVGSMMICGELYENPCQNQDGVCLGGEPYVCNTKGGENTCCNKEAETIRACQAHRQLDGCGIAPEVEICGKFVEPDCGTTCTNNGKCCLNTNACVSNHCSNNADCSFLGLGDRCNTDTCQCN